MDGRRFDELAKAWSTRCTRRTVLRAAAAVVVGASALRGSGEAAARPPWCRSPESTVCRGDCVFSNCGIVPLATADGGTVYGTHAFDPKTCACCRTRGIPCAGGGSSYGCCDGCDPASNTCR